MKKGIILCLILCLMLAGCENGETPTTDATPRTEATNSTPTPDPRLEYYEQLVASLQKELLDLKAALYVSRVEYEELTETLNALEKREEVSEADFRYTVQNGEATVTEYVGRATVVEIPVTLGGYRVCAIADSAFAKHTELTAVQIPEGVRQIGWFAFSGCVMLEKVTLPESLTSIDYGAFEHCKSTLTVTCKDGSYACLWAQSYGIRVQKA